MGLPLNDAAVRPEPSAGADDSEGSNEVAVVEDDSAAVVAVVSSEADVSTEADVSAMADVSSVADVSPVAAVNGASVPAVSAKASVSEAPPFDGSAAIPESVTAASVPGTVPAGWPPQPDKRSNARNTAANLCCRQDLLSLVFWFIVLSLPFKLLCFCCVFPQCIMPLKHLQSGIARPLRKACLSFPCVRHFSRMDPRRNHSGNTKNGRFPFRFMAPQVGLEPTTLRLTAACSTN